MYWYFYWVPHLESMYNNRLYFPKSFSIGTKELFQNIDLTVEKFYFSSLQSFVSFLFFILGLYWIVKRKEKILLYTFCIASFIFILFMIKTGDVFSLHNYYVIPYTPIMAVIVAYAINEIQNIKFKNYNYCNYYD